MAEPYLMMENMHQDYQPTIDAGSVRPDARWYAVQTSPRHEKKVSAELTAKELECFLPTISTLRQWSDRQCSIAEPLFAGYVFVRLAALSSERIKLLRTNGVVGLVGARGIGTPIPEEEILSIRKILEAGTPVSSLPYLSVGQRIRVRGGALDGLEGILQSIKGDQSLVVSVELIQKSISMTISGYQFEPVRESTSVRAVVYG
jgi:transcription antitermination factor NusG